MITRPDVMQHFCETAAPLAGGRCYPVLQAGAGEDAFPSIVYYALAPETIATLSGPHEMALALRYESRARDYAGAAELSRQVLSALRRGGRLIRIGAAVDEYDEALGIYRRIQSVTLNR